jgi:hypothetical protein
MAASVRQLLKFVVRFFAALSGVTATGAMGSPQPQVRPPLSPQVEALTMPPFIARLRQDAALRARFARDPRVVLREHGIDPSPFRLTDRLDETQLDRVLADWTAGAPARVKLAQAAPQAPAAPAPPNVVYGPPPGPPSQAAPPGPPPKPPDQGSPPGPNAGPTPQADPPTPPAPVYGPPPGPPRRQP